MWHSSVCVCQHSQFFYPPASDSWTLKAQVSATMPSLFLWRYLSHTVLGLTPNQWCYFNVIPSTRTVSNCIHQLEGLGSYTEEEGPQLKISPPISDQLSLTTRKQGWWIGSMSKGAYPKTKDLRLIPRTHLPNWPPQIVLSFYCFHWAIL